MPLIIHFWKWTLLDSRSGTGSHGVLPGLCQVQTCSVSQLWKKSVYNCKFVREWWELKSRYLLVWALFRKTVVDRVPIRVVCDHCVQLPFLLHFVREHDKMFQTFQMVVEGFQFITFQWFVGIIHIYLFQNGGSGWEGCQGSLFYVLHHQVSRCDRNGDPTAVANICC